MSNINPVEQFIGKQHNNDQQTGFVEHNVGRIIEPSVPVEQMLNGELIFSNTLMRHHEISQDLMRQRGNI